MTNADTLTLERRPRNAQATRAAILAAGKTQFARSGYEGAFLRDIAADAGADAALINRYFGGKEGLFAACLREAISSEALFKGRRDAFGRGAANVFASRSAPAAEEPMLGFRLILQAATSANTLRSRSLTGGCRIGGRRQGTASRRVEQNDRRR